MEVLVVIHVDVSSYYYYPSRKAEIMFKALMILNNAFILYAKLGTKGFKVSTFGQLFPTMYMLH